MNGVRIVADSGCDISPELAAQYEITVVPCYVQFGQETVSDAELSVEEFWRRAAHLTQTPGTAAPPPSHFQQAFQSLVSGGHDVICLTLPGRYSAVFNSAWVAAQEFGQRVRVIDSRSISLGMGLQVLAAAKQALAGVGIDAIQRSAENMRDRTSVIFVLDTLEWVRHGGRIDHLMPLIEKLARTFQIKPVVEIADGELRLVGVTRSYRSALKRIEEEVRARLPVETVAMAYVRSCEAAHEVASHLGTLLNLAPECILTQEAGPVFATHTGPNALGAVVVRAANQRAGR
jgi:DegV family protein with EDD domain